MNTDGQNSGYDINLSGDSNAYFDELTVGTFQGVTGEYFTGITSNIQTQINGISGSLSGSYVTLATAQNITGQKTFNTTLPTSSVTPNADNQLITRVYADSRYGEITTQNNWTALNTFNNVLPRSLITTATLDAQFVTKGIADVFYARLAVANTFAENNTFTKGILPRTSLTNTNIQLSSNSMVNRQATSLNNIGIGLSTLEGDPLSTYFSTNTGSRNIACGNFALNQACSANDCIAIGYQAMEFPVLERGIGVNPQRNIAIGSFSQRTCGYSMDNISFGYNSFPNNTYGNGNVVIATNGGGGISNKNGCIIIGSNSCPTASENAIISIGESAMGASTGSTLACIAIGQQALYNCRTSGVLGIGFQALFDLTIGYDNQGIGYQAGLGCVSGTFNQFIGRGTTTTKSDVTNSVCVGYGSQTIEDFEFVIGGLASGGYPKLTIPQKVRLNCNKTIGAVGSHTIPWRSNENVIITDPLTTAIYLPEAINATDFHLGACFNIIRTSTATSDITIGAYGTEQICYTGGLHSTFLMNDWLTSISFVCVGSTAGAAVWSIARYNPRVVLANDANQIQTLNNTTNVNFPVCYTTISSGTNYHQVHAEPTFYYNPSIQSLSVVNIKSTGTIDGTATRSTYVKVANNSTTNVSYYLNFSDMIGSTVASLSASVDLRYNPSLAEITVPNLTVTGILTGTATSSTFATLADRAGSSTTYSMIFSNGLGSILGQLGGVTDLTYNPVTKLLNMGPTGAAEGTIQSYISKSTVYQYYEASDLIIAATTLAAYYSYVPFTMKTAAAYSITLPVINSASVGTQITFKRIGGSLQALSITAQSNQPTYLSGNARGTTTATNILVSASQSCSTIVATQTGDVGAGTFTNAAGSATITVVTQSSGTLSIGHIMNLNGNVRFITAYITGNGAGANSTYSINTAITGANTGQPYSTSLTYGWCVTTVA